MSAPGDTSALRSAIVATALRQVGKPYVWGADNPKIGFDCSGLVEYAYAANGVTIPHNSVAQWDACQHIDRSQLQRGDPVFFVGSDPPSPGHEAMFIGGGQVIVAPHSGARVEVMPLVAFTDYVGSGNFLGDAAAATGAPSPAPSTVAAAGVGCATIVLGALATVAALLVGCLILAGVTF